MERVTKVVQQAQEHRAEESRLMQESSSSQLSAPMVDTRTTSVSRDSNKYSAPDPGSREWVNQIEGRFTEYDLTNNILVLNDVTEQFWKKYGRLPKNSTEFTNFVPSLKPRYKDDAERMNGEGWLYRVLYRKKTERVYELCVAAESQPSSIQTWKEWQWSAGLYCVEREL